MHGLLPSSGGQLRAAVVEADLECETNNVVLGWGSAAQHGAAGAGRVPQPRALACERISRCAAGAAKWRRRQRLPRTARVARALAHLRRQLYAGLPVCGQRRSICVQELQLYRPSCIDWARRKGAREAGPRRATKPCPRGGVPVHCPKMGSQLGGGRGAFVDWSWLWRESGSKTLPLLSMRYSYVTDSGSVTARPAGRICNGCWRQ